MFIYILVQLLVNANYDTINLCRKHLDIITLIE